MNIEQLYDMLKGLDTLDEMQEKFAAECIGPGGATWAIERYADDVFFARQMARIVRPLLKAHETMPAHEWLVLVRRANREATDRLINNHGRHNSTSILQNAINQWEAKALSRFVQRLSYHLIDD